MEQIRAIRGGETEAGSVKETGGKTFKIRQKLEISQESMVLKENTQTLELNSVGQPALNGPCVV